MIEMVAALTSRQQTFWATVAQVNAAVVIALVVEIGVAARRYRAREALEAEWRTFIAISVNILSLLFYVVASGLAVLALVLSLVILEGNTAATHALTQQGETWTLLAVLLVLVGPLIALIQYIVGTAGETAIDIARIWRSHVAKRAKRRRSRNPAL